MEAEGMPWEPHKLATKLCRLLDSGYTNVDELARLCGVKPELIEKCANKPNLKLDRDTEFRITKQIAPFMRKYPELYREPERTSKRGVEEVVLRTRDWRGFEVTDSTGKIVMYVEWPAKSATQSRIDGLWRWLDKEDPQPQLSII